MKALLILLGILKWLGIILLALLVLILLIVLVVMLSPIRYHAAGEKKEALCGSFGVSWLFGAVKADGRYTPEEKLKLKVKVLWMTLLGGEEKTEKKSEAKKTTKKTAAKKTTKKKEA
jgi:predicted RND superfamily exporter protein